MATTTKTLKDFVVECNLDGWFCKSKNSGTVSSMTLRMGQKFKGNVICERMVQALEPPIDTYRDESTGKDVPALILIGGTVKELRAAFEANKNKVSIEKETSVENTAKKLAEESESKEEEKKEEKKEKDEEPKRTPRPSNK